MTDPRMTDDLYARVGGDRGIDALVGALYFNILNDQRVARFFRDVSVERVMHHQRLLLREVFGGGTVYAGRSLAAAHRYLIARAGLEPLHFDAMVEILATTLADLCVDGEVAHEVIGRIEPFRSQIFAP